eukprot:gene3856-7688_t
MPLLLITFLFNTYLISKVFSFHWDKSDVDAQNWHITKSGEFDNLTSIRDNNEVKTLLRDKRIVIIGDSLTRYQYLNFVHFLSTNTWISSHPRNEVEGDWLEYGGWKTFFKGTSRRMGCFELCDCRRPEGEGGHESRHYHDPNYNLSIHYFLWLAPHKISGFVSIPTSNEAYADAYANCTFGIPRIINESNFNYSSNIYDFLDQSIRPIYPDSVIVNQGIWPDVDLRTESFHKFAKLLSNITSLPIWKVTTAIFDGKPEETKNTFCTYIRGDFPGPECNPLDSDKMLNLFKGHKIHIYDTYSMSKDLIMEPSAYFDTYHFMPFVYRELNKQLIRQLVSLIRLIDFHSNGNSIALLESHKFQKITNLEFSTPMLNYLIFHYLSPRFHQESAYFKILAISLNDLY